MTCFLSKWQLSIQKAVLVPLHRALPSQLQPSHSLAGKQARTGPCLCGAFPKFLFRSVSETCRNSECPAVVGPSRGLKTVLKRCPRKKAILVLVGQCRVRLKGRSKQTWPSRTWLSGCNLSPSGGTVRAAPPLDPWWACWERARTVNFNLSASWACWEKAGPDFDVLERCDPART